VPIASLVLATIAALLHVLFWVLESLRFRQESVWRRFGVKSAADAEAVAPMAFNQGFYNLFLAVGALVGVGFAALGGDAPHSGWTMYAPLSDAGPPSWLDLNGDLIGSTLIAFTMLCMLGAALVLVATNRKLARAAAIQGGPPALALLIALVA